MANSAESETFVSKGKRPAPTESQSCTSTWWNQGYRPQRAITRIIESYYFRAIVIFLVVVDASLVVTEILLDSFKLHYECEGHIHRELKHHNEHIVERIETGMLAIHFTSISILGLFVVEVFVKIYAFGKDLWNYRRKKMEYLDAVIVITSFAIDVYFLQGEEKILHNRLPLVLSFRLWRFVRIISSVAEGINDGHAEHRERLNKQYSHAIHRLVTIIQHKTSYIEGKESEYSNSALEHFHMIDDKCQSAVDQLDKNRDLTSTASVAHFIEDINGIENGNIASVIPAMFANSSAV